MRIEQIETTVLEMPYTKPLVTATNNFTVARGLLVNHGFPFTESSLLAVEVNSATELHRLTTALLEGEVNVNYLYSFIPHPQGKSILGLSMEDYEIAEEILRRHQFRVLRQADISR